ncbi:MAG: hypothetical protein ACT4OZ_15470 [Gemmatimonadota bacterium]
MPTRFIRLLTTAVFAFAASTMLGAQQAPKLTSGEIRGLAAIQVQITAAHDSMNALLAASRNKTAAAQQTLQGEVRQVISAILARHSLTDAEFQRRRFLVSTDGEMRKEFDATIAKLTGAPLPGQLAAAPVVPVPAGEVGAHLGHIVNGFGDTPDRMGLLPAALAEARIATQHAELASRNTSDLSAMQLHAGHVIHAIDPTVVTMGPGRGYGAKRAATAVAAHIELAAMAAGASANVKTHAVHVATAARAMVTRADQALELARRIRSATAAADAAPLMGQLVSLCQQLTAGADVNGDGRITWDGGEGGLQQAQEHVTLLLRGETPR